ncbi:MAG: dihydrodipicolinate synthase family protein [Rhodopseudomonas palustris]|nr:dihydrodipicolinate synthase family protein [Rhodopseudomonas palustris]
MAPTPFTDDGELDLDGQRRVLDCMVDQGVDGICILANYSEQFLLDRRRARHAARRCASRHVAGRVPVIVTVQPLQHADRRGARAARARPAGAAMLMLMPPYHGATLRADEKGIVRALRARRRRGAAFR